MDSSARRKLGRFSPLLISGFAAFSLQQAPMHSAQAATALEGVDIGTLLPDAAQKSIVKTFGYLMSDRPYQGAESISKDSVIGFDFGVEATLVHTASDFKSSVSGSALGSSTVSALPALPIVKLHLDKSFGPKWDFGITGLYYPGVLSLGVHVKRLIYEPEEGPVYSFRFIYSYANVDLRKLGAPTIPISSNGSTLGKASLLLKSRVWSPQLLASKRLDFAEPYLGVGVAFLSGQIDIPVKLDVLESTQTLSTSPVSAVNPMALMGISFRVPGIFLHLVVEGSYSQLGMHTLGLMLGFGF